MSSLVRNAAVAVVVVLALGASMVAKQSAAPDRAAVLATMKRATTFMMDKVAYKGGYVWSYLPDMSRRWGEMEAKPTMIWIQPPGTPSMGHLYLDAYHATQDESYYRAASQVADALVAGQHPSGGWNYIVDFAGEASLKQWYDTIGKNAWRLEEFQHYYGNATFDDAGTAESSKLLLRLYVEKREPRFKAALDQAIRFVLASQHPIGTWPQRFPPAPAASLHGLPDYTSYPTFNDDVAGENMAFLVMCYQTLGDTRLIDPIIRGMNAFIATQVGPPQSGWGLQHTPDLLPAAARSYEPKAMVTHTTATNLGLLVRFYRLTGETKFLARIPDAIAWLEGLTLPPGVAPAGRTHPTFIEPGTNRPLYVHRRGSNVFNGEYYMDNNPTGTIVHYSSFRKVDIPGLKKMYEDAKATATSDVVKTSPLKLAPGTVPLPKYFTADDAPAAPTPASVVTSLKPEGYWLAPLGSNSHPYTHDGRSTPVAGDFSQTHVGDETDTSPYPDANLMGISIEAYIRNMRILIRSLGEPR